MVVGLLVSLVALTGCTLGEPAGFTSRANRYCASSVRLVGKLKYASTGVDALRYSSARYLVVERTVSELTDDVGLPGGSRGEAYRDRWLRPARASLRQGIDDLNRLRKAIKGNDPAAVASAVTAANAAGTAGVDTGYLAAQKLSDCAVAFAPGHSSR